MKRNLLIVLSVAALCTGAATAQDKTASRPAKAEPTAASHAGHDHASAPPGVDAGMQKWKEMASPGIPHEQFKAMVGKWNVSMKLWMAGPTAPPATSEGTAEFELILGDRFLRQTYKSEFMGMPFEGMGLEGYDNFRKQYTSLWLDNMSTAAGMMYGQCDAASKSCTFFGNMDDPMTGQIGKLVRATSKWIGEKSTFEMFEATANGDWTRTMEIIYTRMK